ncbi:uncharacterized protein CTRU02_206192 [Colletotrichum truncatum]|uniref:Uncharacterized protein n=1 Tax=Colletotrichum truncatum TaxID=5467 RepID=A0ACC3Z693_COLTU|nr:uncharacterized protein CTRU02_10390 [Colletotrichum truncatum]KAF6787127.1 hypothetical protein CTRU02_10390 [Colletotrichum truncatum]
MSSTTDEDTFTDDESFTDDDTEDIYMRPRVIPYEIFLKIIEELIRQAADECIERDIYNLYYKADEEFNLSRSSESNALATSASGDGRGSPGEGNGDSVNPDSISNDETDPMGHNNKFHIKGDLFAQHERYWLTCDLAQIDRRTRAMVHRRFRRFPAAHNFPQPPEEIIIDSWMDFERDVFRPQILRDEESSPLIAARQRGLRHAMLHPTPRLRGVLDYIQLVEFHNVDFFKQDNKNTIDAVLALPSLRELVIYAGRLGYGSGIDHSHKRPMRIDKEIFPELARWKKAHGDSFEALSKPFRDRKIDIFARVDDTGDCLPLLYTPGGIRVMIEETICSCDKVVWVYPSNVREETPPM